MSSFPSLRTAMPACVLAALSIAWMPTLTHAQISQDGATNIIYGLGGGGGHVKSGNPPGRTGPQDAKVEVDPSQAQPAHKTNNLKQIAIGHHNLSESRGTAAGPHVKVLDGSTRAGEPAAANGGTGTIIMPGANTYTPVTGQTACADGKPVAPGTPEKCEARR